MTKEEYERNDWIDADVLIKYDDGANRFMDVPAKAIGKTFSHNNCIDIVYEEYNKISLLPIKRKSFFHYAYINIVKKCIIPLPLPG